MARKILLADDSVTAQNMGRKILVDAGYEVIAVNNGSAAMKKIAELKPDLAILDVYMPGYSGLEVCQRLKDSPDSSRIPVLLSVGKLEPFKPEEALRVRAEAYIVKPFEATELLSALSKLEDKVVPRAEPSRPGRFARALAAEENTRGARAESRGNGKDAKNQTGSTPPKGEPEEKVQDSSSYRALNRDVPTEVGTTAEKGAEKHIEAQPSPAAESTVDVAALAPSGLPNDVTPEEVAAIAAAVAKMQLAGAVIQDDRVNEASQKVCEPSALDNHEPHSPVDESAGTTAVASQAVAPEAVASQVAVSQIQPETSEDQEKKEATSESTAERWPATVDTNSGEKIAENESKESPGTPDVPVTMAASAESVASAGGSRWTAVAVALESHETGISLEEEMLRAHAATRPYTAALSDTEFRAASAENPSSPIIVESKPSEPSIIDSPQLTDLTLLIAEHASLHAEPSSQPEVALPASLSTSENSNVINPTNLTAPQSEAPIPPVAEATSESPIPAVASTTEAPASEAQPSVAEVAQSNQDAPIPSHAVPESSMISDQQPESAQAVEAATQAHEVHDAAPQPVIDDASLAWSDGYRSFIRKESAPVESKPDAEAVKSTAAAWESWRQIRDTNKPVEVAQPQPESQPAEANAAVPANAEAPVEPATVQQEPAQVSEAATISAEQVAAAENTAARAVAAGAEQTAVEAAASESAGDASDIAGIVDSLLADLRPRLMEEISRKMAQKK